MTELSRLLGSEEYDTCGDAVPPRPPKETAISKEVAVSFGFSSLDHCRFQRRDKSEEKREGDVVAI